jgi:hypothetical protein
MTTTTAHLIEINYINGFCGSGKTFAIARFAKQQVERGNKVLLVQPTKNLIDETITTTFAACGIDRSDYRTISSATHSRATTAIREHLDNPADGGEILVVTHSGFFGLSYFPNKDKWIVIIDEIPTVDISYTLNIPDTHNLLTAHIEVVDSGHILYHRIAQKAGSQGLSEFAKNSNGDDVIKTFAPFAKHVTSASWEMYVLADNYKRLINRVDDASARQLVAFGILKPEALSGFRQVYMAAACFTESLLYLLWSNWEAADIAVVFVDKTSSFSLRYESHVNGDLVDIYYAIDGRWSKTVQDEITPSGLTMMEAVTAKATALIGSSRSAYFANANIVDTPFENGVRLPNISHGLNIYQGIDHAVAVSALNPSPAHFAFLKRFADIDGDAVQTAMTRQAIYQAICRTSIRDVNNRNRKIWIVPDSRTAAWLQDLFPGSSIHDLGIGHTKSKGGRPRVHANANDCLRAHRAKLKRKKHIRAQRRLRVLIVNSVTVDVDTLSASTTVFADMSSQIANINLSTIVGTSTFQGTLFNTKMEKTGDEIVGTFDDLIGLYRKFAKVKYPSKDECPAYSPSHYVANNSATSRGYDNIAFTRNIILDYDGGEMAPQDFAAIFPAWRMVFHSSWSHSSSTPKWRVLIPTDVVVDIDGYKLITSHIMHVLAVKGWHSPKALASSPNAARSSSYKGVHGFDVTKMNPACVLYVPSQGANPADQFFTEFNEPSRGDLDVLAVVDQAEIEDDIPLVITKAPAPVVVKANASPALRKLVEAMHQRDSAIFAASKAKAITDAVAEYGANAYRGNRDNAVFTLVLRLHHAGGDYNEVVAEATAAISSAPGSRRELIAKAKRAAKRVCR